MTIKTIEVSEAQQQLAELLEQVAAGTEIILTEGDTPRARLLPIEPSPSQRVPGLHRGGITASPDFDAPLPDKFWAGETEKS